MHKQPRLIVSHKQLLSVSSQALQPVSDLRDSWQRAEESNEWVGFSRKIPPRLLLSTAVLWPLLQQSAAPVALFLAAVSHSATDWVSASVARDYPHA